MINTGESALVVPVDAAEPVVGKWRLAFDPSASWGVPAHITVVYPFVRPEHLDSHMIDRIRDVLQPVNSFDIQFDELAEFEGDVLYLAPEPAAPLRDLTARVVSEWPDHLPYEGVHNEVVPHLTVATSSGLHLFEDIARDVGHKLPIRARVDSVLLMTGTPEPGAWNVRASFNLAGSKAVGIVHDH